MCYNIKCKVKEIIHQKKEEIKMKSNYKIIEMNRKDTKDFRTIAYFEDKATASEYVAFKNNHNEIDKVFYFFIKNV